MGQLLPNHGKRQRFSETPGIDDTEAEPACGGAEHLSMAHSLSGGTTQ